MSDTPSDTPSVAEPSGAARAVFPAMPGWLTLGPEPHLIGSRCRACKSYFFPRETRSCRNPGCGSSELAEVELSRTGVVWSFTSSAYPPPPPYVAAEPFVPFAIAAVALETEALVILGQVAAGVSVDDLRIGMPVELVVEPLYSDEHADYLVWRWLPRQSS